MDGLPTEIIIHIASYLPAASKVNYLSSCVYSLDILHDLKYQQQITGSVILAVYYRHYKRDGRPRKHVLRAKLEQTLLQTYDHTVWTGVNYLKHVVNVAKKSLQVKHCMHHRAVYNNMKRSSAECLAIRPMCKMGTIGA